VLEKVHIENKPGGAANVALNIKSLGSIPYLFGITGVDTPGTILIDLLKQEGIDSKNLIRVNERPTTVKTRIMASGQHILRIDEEISDEISSELEEKLKSGFDKLTDKIKIDALIFQDYNKGLLSQGLIDHITKECQKKGIFTAVDPKFKNFLSYKSVDFFKPNLKEISSVLNINISPFLDDLEYATDMLNKELNFTNIFITLGDKGIYYSNGTKSEMIPTKKKNIVDVSGAGDVVISAATLLFLSGNEIDTIAEISNIAGGLACDSLGVATVSKEQLTQAISKTMYT
jgi:D-glycero-beta-D-manno-heptose-7-phosphate kinase